MSFLKTMINSMFRVFGRILAYIVIGIIIMLLFGGFVNARTIDEFSLTTAGGTTNLTEYNVTSVGVTNTWSFATLRYNVSGSNGQNILFSSQYELTTYGTNVYASTLAIWYLGTDNSWNQVIDNCERNIQRYNYAHSTKWNYSIVCNIPATKNFNTIVLSINMVDSNGNNINTGGIAFNQKSNTATVSGTSNEAIGDSINNNNDKNTTIITNNDDENTEKITDAINNQYDTCNQYNIVKDNSTKNNDIPGFLDSNGNIGNGNDWYVTSEYIWVNAGKTYNLNISGTTIWEVPSYCLYDTNKEKVSCQAYNNGTNYNITPNVNGYIRFTYSSWRTTVFTGEYCYNRLDKQTEEQEETNNILTRLYNGVMGLPDLIINGIKGLFVPDDLTFIDNFLETLEDKLGFIYSIPAQVLTFLFGLPDYDYEEFTGFTFPSFTLFNYDLWGDQVIDITDIKTTLAPYKIYTSIGCVILCINTLYKYYERFANGGAES